MRDANPESRPFWDGVRAGKCVLQRCDSCQQYRFYPRAVCPHCLAPGGEWVTVAGRGSIYSFTVVRRVASEDFRLQPPYAVALVDLEEGVRMMAPVVDLPLDQVRIGLNVRFRAVTEPDGEPGFEFITVAGGIEH